MSSIKKSFIFYALNCKRKRICAEGVNIINPGFDVTPHELISGIITEKGILRPDYKTSIEKLFYKIGL